MVQLWQMWSWHVQSSSGVTCSFSWRHDQTWQIASLIFLLFVCQATLSVIKNVVLEVQASNQKNRLLETSSEASGQEASHGPSLLQGEAELAYLTHEGLFISDALNEAEQQRQQAVVQDQSSVSGSRMQQSRPEAASGNSACGTTETSISFMFVFNDFFTV